MPAVKSGLLTLKPSALSKFPAPSPIEIVVSVPYSLAVIVN